MSCSVSMVEGRPSWYDLGRHEFAAERQRRRKSQRGRKRAGWDCPYCDFLNFKKNTNCLVCWCAKPPCAPSEQPQVQEQKKDSEVKAPVPDQRRNRRSRRRSKNEEWKPLKSWDCPWCGFMNFNRNTTCLVCWSAKPHVVGRGRRLSSC